MTLAPMEINLLYFDGCPSWENALANLRTALREESLDVSIGLVEVKSDQAAAAAKFLGSPSFQFEGQDFWPEDRKTYSMNCRVYRTPEGLRGCPTVEMFRQKIRELTIEKGLLK
jgi:hypothetical protein